MTTFRTLQKPLRPLFESSLFPLASLSHPRPYGRPPLLGPPKLIPRGIFGLLYRRGLASTEIDVPTQSPPQNNDSIHDFLEIQVRESMLTHAFKDFEEVEKQIVVLDISKVDKDDVEDKYLTCVTKMQRKILELSPQAPTQVRHIVPQHSHSPNVSLPQISIPPFNGDITKWNAFFQLFSTLILDNQSLSDIQRLIYLKSYLRDEPLNLVDNLQLTTDNLQIALNTLRQRYDNQLSIIFAHIKNLVDIPILNKVSSHTLREFIVCIKQNFDSLKNQNIPVYHWDLILIYIFSQKLDFGTRKAYISERGSQMRSSSHVVPKLEEFLSFLEKRCSVLEDLSESPSTRNYSHGRSSQHNTPFVKKNSHYAHGRQRQGNQVIPQNSPQNSRSHFVAGQKCPFCEHPDHKIYTCFKFKDLSLKQKQDFVNHNNLCFNCLGSRHQVKTCTSQRCQICHMKHHSLLHPMDDAAQPLQSRNSHWRPNPQTQNERSQNFNRNSLLINSSHSRNQGSSQSSSQTQEPQIPSTSNEINSNRPHANKPVILSVFATEDNEVSLGTSLIQIPDKNGHFIIAKAILDPGSTISIVTQSLVQRLDLSPKTQPIQISGIGGKIKHSNHAISLRIHSCHNHDYFLNVNCCVLDKITEKSPHFKVNKFMLNLPNNTPLADPYFDTPSTIDLLLGADVYYHILSGEYTKVNKDSLTLVGTYFGHILSGLIPFQALVHKTPLANSKNCFLVQSLNSDCSLDSLIEKFWLLEDVSPTHEKPLSPEDSMVEQNFQNTTVFKDGHFQVDLPLKRPQESHPLGESYSLAKKRFHHLEKRFQKSPDLFLEYKKFIGEYISLNHARIIPLSLKTENHKNRYFLPHHCVIREDSTSTKLRVVFDGSMKTSSGLSLNDVMHKGYTVQPELFDILLRFRSFKFALTSDIEKMYRQVRVNPNQTYLQNILWRDHPSQPMQCIELLTVTYGTNCAPYLATRTLNELAIIHKDDYPLASQAILSQCYVDDVLCGQDTYENLVELHRQLLELCKIGNFHLHKWCSNSNLFLSKTCDNGSQESFTIETEEISNKVLGVGWNPDSDEFFISLPDTRSESIITKRIVLSKIAQMYDPLGFIAPIVVNAKLIMQNIWKEKINWDEPLKEPILTQWTTFIKELPQLMCLKIPRFFLANNNPSSLQIHGFSDASRKAYGACVYIRALYPNKNVSCQLITAKSRVAPIREITIPRMELCGALLLSNLVTRVCSILKERFSVDNINLWTDSEIVLAWLNAHPSRFNVFVANRISQIQVLSQDCKWRHIPTADNPADHLSRGFTADQILTSTLWWNGPKFLLDPNLNLKMYEKGPCSTEEEARKAKTVLLVNSEDFWITLFNRFSNFSRLQRTIAFIHRFVNNCKGNGKKFYGALAVTELKAAEIFIVKQVQHQTFSKEISELKSEERKISNKQVLRLNPFIDTSNLIRVGGRLSQAPISFDQKFPILLPSKNHVVGLLLKKEHIRLGHAGEQIMADLPKSRVVPSRPFLTTGVDFGGPFIIKSSSLRRAKIEKAYIALFVCMVTKAVHLELVSSLSSQAFLACFKRFISRRGCPATIFSDNGTNFSGASNQIKEVYDTLKSQQTQEQLTAFFSCHEIQWQFIPPFSPHWGGLWEAAIKSTKHHLRRLIGNQNLTFEDFSTILAQIEAILNSRPLLPLSADPLDLTCLTPGHFLVGSPLVSYPEPNVSSIPENRLDRWQRLSQIQQFFWTRWTKEYLNNLQNRPKWMSPVPNIETNDLVLLKDENTKPLDWPLARVVDTLPNKDGKIRLVKIRTKNGIFTRNITKLCPLPKSDSNLV
ncbi:uncharacterized protein LOC126737642 [Anthonomus grandis grandis]|uniref:uncharacterized protein LOC126737642 n=1 Tax=Anthonomus grandis grandis TaxID=2921223 RepID=UPI002165D848|nr:uncharacterized protein LOC126737642 [Anthonomus grandis grandis]